MDRNCVGHEWKLAAGDYRRVLLQPDFPIGHFLPKYVGKFVVSVGESQSGQRLESASLHTTGCRLGW